MGLKNSAPSFQKVMDHIFGDLGNCFVYMDDILLHSKNEKEHLTLKERFLTRLEENGLAINLDKCEFGSSSISFLGYHITANGITPIPKKIQAINQFPAPKTPKDLLGILGAVNY